MNDFFIFLGVMVTVNAIGWIPVFIINFINDCEMDEALFNWHCIMTMMIAVLLSYFVLDPSLFNLMWID